MQDGPGWYGDGSKSWLAKLRAGRGYGEAGPVQVAYGEASSEEVNKVAGRSSAVCQHSSLVSPVEQLAVVDEQAGGYSMT